MEPQDLKKVLGDDLYGKLTDEQREFLLKTCGSLGPIDSHAHRWDFAGQKPSYGFAGLAYQVYVICHECGSVEERTVSDS